MKTLLLARHAKSSWHDPSLADFDRLLNERGKRDAPRMGAWLASQGISPSHIISSPALRAHVTAQQLAMALAYPVDHIEYEEALYAADSQKMLAIIKHTDDRHDSVMLVGHNPALTDVVNRLAGADITNVPTCGVAVIKFNVKHWDEIVDAPGQLLSLYIPKQLPGTN
ncbi:MAG: histidine phosphatase family protein [Granulosicoccaceae bacterium]|jgi:phosphohistidine phosphatase